LGQTMNNISTIDGMHLFLQNEFSVVISCRGRKFKINGEELTLNAIVKKVQSIASTSMPDDETANQQLCDISHRIKQMDREGNIELGKQNFFLKIATFFRRLFGNLGFNRNTILADIQSRPLKMLVTAFSNISKDLMESELKIYEDFNSQYQALKANEKNDPKVLKNIKENCDINNINRLAKFSEDQINAYKKADKNYGKILKLYKNHSHDSDLKILFDSIQADRTHVLYLLTLIEDKSFIWEYLKNDSKWKTEDNKIFFGICEMNQMAKNKLIEHVKKLNEFYEKLDWNGHSVKEYLDECLELSEKVKTVDLEGLKKLIDELTQKFNPKDSDTKYLSTVSKLESLFNSKSDYEFVLKNLVDNDQHLLIFFLNSLKTELMDYLSQDFEWPNKVVKGKFEKLKGINLRMKQLLSKSE
jgi:hypothetical protein